MRNLTIRSGAEGFVFAACIRTRAGLGLFSCVGFLCSAAGEQSEADRGDEGDVDGTHSGSSGRDGVLGRGSMARPPGWVNAVIVRMT